MLRYLLPLVFCYLPTVCMAQDANAGTGHHTRIEFQSLRWLEGDWQGTGGQRPFYERYDMLNDSTIQIHYYVDSTRTEERGRGSVFLSQGVIYHTADGATWVAVQLDSTGIHFAPYRGADNSFRWTRISPTAWEAVLQFEGGREARYELTRISN
jgi:hypothetical protein